MTEKGASLSNGAALAVALALFGAPTALFALTMRAPYAISLGVGALACIVLGARALATGQGDFLGAALDARRLLVCLALAAFLLLLGGETHLFRPTTDWYLRDAVLADLVKGGFPVVYRVNDADFMLRAPLGMYVLPALAGQIVGLKGAHVAMLAQNALLFGVILYALLSLGRGWTNLVIVLGFAGVAGLIRFLGYLGSGRIETMIPGNDTTDAWNSLLQYSGSITQLFWVPNHALPGWLLAVLLLLRARREIDVATVGVAVALLLFWSPLAILPAVPTLVYFTLKAPRETLLARRTWLGLIAALLCLPVVAYVTAASDTVPRPDILGDEKFWPTYFAFLPVQLGAAIVVWYLRARAPAEWLALLWVNVALLVALPFFSFGEFNDLVMRGSIASLTILAFVFGFVLSDGTGKRSAADWAGLALVVIAATSGAYEIYRALAWKTYPISACSVMDVAQATRRRVPQTNYIARVDARLQGLFGATRAPLEATTWTPPPAGEKPEWPDTLTMASPCWGAP